MRLVPSTVTCLLQQSNIRRLAWQPRCQRHNLTFVPYRDANCVGGVHIWLSLISCPACQGWRRVEIDRALEWLVCVVRLPKAQESLLLTPPDSMTTLLRRPLTRNRKAPGTCIWFMRPPRDNASFALPSKTLSAKQEWSPRHLAAMGNITRTRD